MHYLKDHDELMEFLALQGLYTYEEPKQFPCYAYLIVTHWGQQAQSPVYLYEDNLMEMIGKITGQVTASPSAEPPLRLFDVYQWMKKKEELIGDKVRLSLSHTYGDVLEVQTHFTLKDFHTLERVPTALLEYPNPEMENYLFLRIRRTYERQFNPVATVCTYAGCQAPAIKHGYCAEHQYVYYMSDDYPGMQEWTTKP